MRAREMKIFEPISPKIFGLIDSPDSIIHRPVFIGTYSVSNFDIFILEKKGEKEGSLAEWV